MCFKIALKTVYRHAVYLLLQINKRTGLPAINIYTDKDSGKPKGDATLSYEDPPAAKAAVEWFDGVLVCFLIHTSLKHVLL